MNTTVSKLSAFVVFFLFANVALSQSPTYTRQIGDAFYQEGFAAVPTGVSDILIGGVYDTDPGVFTGQSQSGILIPSPNPSQVPTAVQKLTNSGFNFSIAGMDRNANVIAIVANELADASGSNSNPMFMLMDNSLNLISARSFNQSTNDRLNKVKVLADGSSILVGKTTNASNVSNSLIVKIGPAPFCVMQWARTIGLPTGPNHIDEAYAVEQLANGNFLVAGNTVHYAQNGSISIYLALFSPTGTLLQFHGYTPVNYKAYVNDMAVLSTGEVCVVGSAVNTSRQTDAFFMTVTANLASANFKLVNQAGNIGRIEQLNAVIAVNSNSRFYLAGYGENLRAGVIDKDALAIRINATGTVDMIKGYTIQDHRNNFYNEIILHPNERLEFVGASESFLVPMPLFGIMEVFSTRVNLDLDICLANAVIAYQMPLVPDFHYQVNPDIGNSYSFISDAPVITSINLNTSNVCSASQKQSDDPLQSGQDAFDVFPNPTSQFVTLRLQHENEQAEIRIFNLSGKSEREFYLMESETTIDISALPAGMYFITARFGETLVTKKLIVE